MQYLRKKSSIILLLNHAEKTPITGTCQIHKTHNTCQVHHTHNASKFKHSYEASQNLWRTYKLCSRYFLEISPVINQYNPLPSFFMLVLDFMVHRVILIIVKCLSANQNQLFLHKSFIYEFISFLRSYKFYMCCDFSDIEDNKGLFIFSEIKNHNHFIIIRVTVRVLH